MGNQKELQIGRVVEVHKVDLAQRFGLEPRSVGAKLLVDRFGDLMVVQMTILVDEIDIDPEALDYLSYTFWCELTAEVESAEKDDIAHVELYPANIFDKERRWVAESVQIVQPGRGAD